MAITDFAFQTQIFFAKHSRIIAGDEAQLWVDKLTEYAQWSFTPIVALVDASEVSQITFPAHSLLTKASFINNVSAIVIASSSNAQLTFKNIALLGKRNSIVICPTLDEARRHAKGLVQAKR